MTPAARYGWLADATLRGDLVVTASRRLARELSAAFDASMVAAGERSWATPAIRFWQDWLAHVLEQADRDDLPQLLEPSVTTLLWEQSLGRTARRDLLSVGGAVNHAQAAWTRLHDWTVSPEELAAAAASRDEHWFVRASTAFRSRLADGGWTDAAGLAGVCTGHAATPGLSWPRRLLYAGFDRLTPALEALFAALAREGIEIARAPEPSHSGSGGLRAYPDTASLWRAAGRWARDTLEREPAARVAVLAPDLETDAGRIGRLVREGFAPGWQLGGAAYRDAVNLSYGKPLNAYPAVATTLLGLALAARGLRGAEVSLLLQSPFLGLAGAGVRARLELHLRNEPDRLWTPPDLVAVFDALGENESDWRNRFDALGQLFDARRERLPPSAWAQRIDGCLETLGWPGAAPLDSEEFQLVNRWRQLLNQLARLGRAQSSMSLPDAIRRLQRIAADTVYQPEADGGALNVLGLLEAAGFEFDFLWVGGVDASRWPPARTPLALVNRRLQRDAGMPDATPADTLEFAERTLRRLRRAARELCFAFARSDGETQLAPSPLLGAAARAREPESDDPGWFAAASLGSGLLRHVEPDAAPPVAAGEKIRGGSYTVQRMREEPFAAFVKGRLAADPLEPFSAGLSPRLRGQLAHGALESLLRERPSQRELCQWSDREQRIRRAVENAQARQSRHADAVLRELLQLESRRLEELLATFVERECERDEFAVVALEEKLGLDRGALHLDLRLDRIDRLADGKLLLADYKTGASKRFLTKDGVPTTVQMSVYACAVDEPVGALAFINLDSRDVGYDGAGDGFASGNRRIASNDWPGTLAEWQREVEGLLRRFANGEIGVNILQSVNDARPLALLSRVEELRRDG